MNHDVVLELQGSLLERLLQRALARGAQLQEVRRLGPRSMRISCDEASAALLMEMCRKYGLNGRVIRRGGRSAALKKMRARWTLLPGFLLCILICALALSRLWMVDVEFTGPAAALGSEAEMRRCLENMGVRPGMAAGEIDCSLLQKKLMAESGDYSYIGVSRTGVRLLVEAAPELPSPELYDREYARDLVAGRDGVVVSVNARSGKACVEAGDTVRAGQTLIRGEEAVGKDRESGEEITAPVSALGEVTARCWYEGSAEGSLEETISRRSGNSRTACRLRLLDYSLSILEGEAYESCETEAEILPVVGLFLPLEIERTTYHETVEETVRADEKLLLERLLAMAQAQAKLAMAEDGIEEPPAVFWHEETTVGNRLRVRAAYEICTDIAVTREELGRQLEEVY